MPKVHILGAGTPTPTPQRFGSSYVIEMGDNQIMLDCGPASTHKLVKAGLWPTNIDHLFFTHHHFDHDADYPCFLLCRWDQSIGKEDQLKVFGPQPTVKLTEGLIGEDGVFSHDWKARIHHPVSQRVFMNRGGTLPRKPPDVYAEDIDPGYVYSGPDWQMSTSWADHVQPYIDSVAYRLDGPGGSIVFTGDTAPCDEVIDLAKDADMMLCMCWDDQETMDRNGEAAQQCGTTGAAKMAQAAGVKKLVLVHIGPNLSTRGVMEKGIGDVKRLYDGELIFSDELMTVDL